MTSRITSVGQHTNKPVPEQIPGYRITDSTDLDDLKGRLQHLCQSASRRFPGSQPVSFDFNSLDLLEQEDFWVCEKSDGVRVLVMIVGTPTGQDIFLIDRKEDFYHNGNLTFPSHEGSNYNTSNTVLDGELVIDVDPATGGHQLKLLLFDCLVMDGINLMGKPLSSRFGRLKNWIIEPHKAWLATQHPTDHQRPFEVELKVQELAYGIDAVFKVHLPRLRHGNDGLIFTSAEAPYTSGTDYKILKWKPPSENSIDFLLQLKFPSSERSPKEVDLLAKPAFMLYMNQGRGVGPLFFDVMKVDDETWEDWKRSGEQYDDRVVEVVWSKELDSFQFMRFRDDKNEGNYKDVVTSIIRSIQDGVEAEGLVARAGSIKKAWKLRAEQRAEAERRRIEEEKERRRQEKLSMGQGNGRASYPTSNGGGGNALKR